MSILKAKTEADTLPNPYWEPSLGSSIQLKNQNIKDSDKFSYPMFRNFFPGLTIAAIGMAIGTAGYFVTAPGIGIGPATSIAASALIMGTALGCTLTGLYIAATKLTVEVSQIGIKVTRNILGFPFRRFIEASSISDIKLTTKVNRSHDQVLGVMCRLNLILDNGRYVSVGDSLHNVTEAQAIQEKMIKNLGSSWSRCLPGDSKHDFRNTGPGILGSFLVLLKMLIIFAFAYDIMTL